MPPNNHGVVVLIMLKMMERLGRLGDDPDSPERFHVMLEVARLAYAMRDEFVADPDMADVPLDHMLADATIDDLVGRIDRSRAMSEVGPVPQPVGTDTDAALDRIIEAERRAEAHKDLLERGGAEE